MLHKMSADISSLKEGLDPENIALWYKKVIGEAKEMAPPWLADKISVKQDSILYLKFNLDISKRAVRYLPPSLPNNLPPMPHPTPSSFFNPQPPTTQHLPNPPLSAHSSALSTTFPSPPAF